MSHLSLLALETALFAGLVLWLLRWRGRLGLAPLFITLGALQVVEAALAASPPVEILPGIEFGLGWAVLSTGTLFAVLLVYISEDASRARELIVGLAVARLSASLIAHVAAVQPGVSGDREALALPPATWIPDPLPTLLDSFLLVLGSVAMIIAYESFSRLLPRVVLLRLMASATAVLALDSAIRAAVGETAGGAFPARWVEPLAGRVLIALLLSSGLALYYRFFHRRELETELAVAERRGLLEVVSTRNRFDRMRALVVRDSLTGLFNRGFFDEVLALELARAGRSGLPTSLLLLDLDHFKRINDRHGHPVGDRVLQEVAATLAGTVRESDAACRIGGEEFAVVLPHAAAGAAMQTAERIRERLASRVESASPPLADGRVTVTIGLASFPAEAATAEELVKLADARLYEGKSRGRDCVVGGKV